MPEQKATPVVSKIQSESKSTQQTLTKHKPLPEWKAPHQWPAKSVPPVNQGGPLNGGRGLCHPPFLVAMSGAKSCEGLDLPPLVPRKGSRKAGKNPVQNRGKLAEIPANMANTVVDEKFCSSHPTIHIILFLLGRELPPPTPKNITARSAPVSSAAAMNAESLMRTF